MKKEQRGQRRARADDQSPRTAEGLRALRSVGMLVLREQPERALLTLCHGGRHDLPKGHMRPGELELQTAWRELREETGLGPDQVELVPDFRCEHVYHPRYRRFGGEQVEKTVVIYLGRLQGTPPTLRLGEHDGFRWVAWADRRRTGNSTVDLAVERLEAFFGGD